MRKQSIKRIEACIIGIVTLVMMPMLLAAQTISSGNETAPPVVRTFTAPPPKPRQEAPKALATNEPPKPMQNSMSELEPRVEIVRMLSSSPDHRPAGFCATYKPTTYDTVYIYEGETDKFVVVGIHANKEVIQGSDSGGVAEEVSFRMNHFNENDIPVANEQHAKTNSMIIRSGFIPAQGFGSMRYRFAVKPGQFTLSSSSMISASVHMTHSENIGTILCAVTNIDLKKGIFYVETSNEVPKGEEINWIIVNSM